MEKHNIKQLEAAYAYKHDFEMFGYSVQEYLSNMNVSHSVPECGFEGLK